MSVLRLRLLGLMIVSAWLAVGCSGAKKIDVGGACILNSDCNQPLVCTMGKCHDACHTSADCPTGQSCVKTDNSTICQLPAEGDCSKTASCAVGFVCASDQRCRTACQSPTDCTTEQACLSGICHDACQVSADCPTGQSCVRTNNTTLCQLPAEADCSKTLSCSGAFVCAPDLHCRTACLSRTDCTTEQICVSGVCAAPSDLDPNGQLPQKGPSLGADGGVNAPDAGGQGPDVTVGPADAGSLDSGADLPIGAADARGREVSASDLANLVSDAPLSMQPDSGAGTGSDAKTADGGGGLTTPDAGVADRSPAPPDSSGAVSVDAESSGGASKVQTGCSWPSTTVRYFCDDFEADLSKWTLSGQDWGPITSTARSDTTSLTDSPAGNYALGANASATIAVPVNLTGATAPVLTFWQKLSLSCGGAYHTCRTAAGDYAYVEASSDGGLTWSVLAKLNNVDNTSTWSQQVYSLQPYVNARLKIRFRLWDDSGSESFGGPPTLGDGWYVDDVEIREFDLVSAPPTTSGGCGAATSMRYFCDGFEAGLDNWVVSSKDWNTTTSSSAVSGTHSLADSPGGNYPDSAISSAALARSVDLNGATAPVLTFWHKLALAYEVYGNGESNCRSTDYGDYTYVEVSTDGGLTWSQVAKFTNIGNTSTWSQQTVGLQSYVKTRLSLRFRLWDNAKGAGATGDGWAIDDVEIRELDLDLAPPNPAGGCGTPTTARYFCDSFEEGLANWTLSGEDWSTTNSGAVSGSRCLTDSPDGNYPNSAIASAALAGNVDLRLASKPVLTFWHKLALDTYNFGSDAAYVEVSSDGGMTWQQLASFKSGANTSTWSQQMLDLASFQGQRVKIRFRQWDDVLGAQHTGDGWYIDDVEIREVF